jgi:hypothetical protein
MLSVISKIWGVITLIFATICLFPFLGWANWGVILFAIIGTILGALSSTKGGMYMSIVALVIAFFRLIIGGGLF